MTPHADLSYMHAQRLILSCLQSDACIGPRFARRQCLMGHADAEALEPAMGPLAEHSGVSRADDLPRSREGREQWLTTGLCRATKNEVWLV
jgi:hypothetical protein